MFVANLRTFLVLGVVCVLGYPALLLGFAAVANPAGAEGSLIRDQAGMVRGSRLIAQSFTQPGYLWPRPSAVAYDGGGAGGSNLSPAGATFRERVVGDLDRLDANPAEPVPADLVTASGSGLDPHVTLAGARYQAQRIAAVRGVAVDEVLALLETHSEEVTSLGAGRIVNVLIMNQAMDERWPLQEVHERP